MGWLVKAPARFLLILLLVWAFIVLLLIIDTVATRDADTLGGTLPVVSIGHHALLVGLLPATLVTLGLQLMRIKRSSDHPLALRVILFVLSGLVLMGGFTLLQGTYRDAEARLATVRYALEDQTIYRFEDRSVYLDDVETLAVRNILVIKRPFGEWVEAYPEGRVLPGEERQRLQIPGVEEPLDLGEAYGGPWRGPRSSAVFASLTGEFRALNRALLSVPPLSPGFLLRIASILLLVVSGWVFIRLTRWPLFNILLFLLVMRASLWIPQFAAHPFVQEMVEPYLGPEVLPMAPYLVLLALSGLFLLVNVLLPGLRHWERETLDG